MLTSGRLEALLEGLPAARVAVVGDFCLDVYWSLDMDASEPSLETGKPTQPVREQRYSLGGAGNVLANLHDLGVGSLSAFGAVGDDPFGGRLLSLLRELDTDCEGMLLSRDASWQTLAYCKPYVGDDELSRLDLGDFNKLPVSTGDRLLELLEASLPRLDVVVVNQKVEAGLHTPAFRSALRGLMQRCGDTAFVFDGRHLPRVHHREGMTYLRALLGAPGHPIDTLDMYRQLHPLPPEAVRPTAAAVDREELEHFGTGQSPQRRIDSKQQAQLLEYRRKHEGMRDDPKATPENRRAAKAKIMDIDKALSECRVANAHGGTIFEPREIKQPRQNVCTAVTRAVDHLAKHSSELAKHLGNVRDGGSIFMGRTLVYAGGLPWTTD